MNRRAETGGAGAPPPSSGSRLIREPARRGMRVLRVLGCGAVRRRVGRGVVELLPLAVVGVGVVIRELFVDLHDLVRRGVRVLRVLGCGVVSWRGGRGVVGLRALTVVGVGVGLPLLVSGFGVIRESFVDLHGSFLGWARRGMRVRPAPGRDAPNRRAGLGVVGASPPPAAVALCVPTVDPRDPVLRRQSRAGCGCVQSWAAVP